MMSISPDRLTPLKRIIEGERLKQQLNDQANAIQYLAQENNALIEILNKWGML